MTLDEVLLADVEAARARVEHLEDAVWRARSEMHQAIRLLHRAGGSLREIAGALAMSHQRVHQIIGEDGIVEVEAPPPTISASTAGSDTDACSFCGAPRRELDRMLAAPGGAYVCSRCVDRVLTVLNGDGAEGVTLVTGALTCSFCGVKAQPDALLASSDNGTTRMCEDCAGTCNRILGTTDDKARKGAGRGTLVRCSFCNVSQKETKKLIAGPGVYICEVCIDGANTVIATADVGRTERGTTLTPVGHERNRCEFCGKPSKEVTQIVKGNRSRICNECVQLCNDILEEEAKA